MLTVYNPSYDSTWCQDYMGLQGSYNITDISGTTTTNTVNMGWRFKWDCPTLPKSLWGGPAHNPGTWGPNINVSSVIMSGNTCGSGWGAAQQVGRYLRFAAFESNCHTVSINLTH